MRYILKYKELIYNLVVSELKNKYSSSVLGFAWSMLNPLLMTLVLYMVFQNIFRFTQKDLAFYILIGMTGWRFFANGTTIAMMSIVGKSNLVTKLYIPREILTLSSVLASLISSILEFIVLIFILVFFGIVSVKILMFPLMYVFYLPIVYGVSLMLASLYVYFRDLNSIWEVLIQIGFFLSPIVYPMSTIPEKYKFYYMLNPITRLIEMYRDILLNDSFPKITDFALTFMFGVFLFILGSLLFRKLNRRFAEEI
jgi:lipopolysaccharide transport system permease protein